MMNKSSFTTEVITICTSDHIHGFKVDVKEKHLGLYKRILLKIELYVSEKSDTM